ncbi:MAG: protein kinase [Candidatus Eremiobacterota bacterium]
MATETLTLLERGPTRPLDPGQALRDGDWVVTRVLSWSTRGGVYRVRNRGGSEYRVARELIPPLSMDEEEIARRRVFLEHLMGMLAHLSHPCLARVYDHFPEGRRHYVIEEEVEGLPLERLLEMALNPLPREQVLGWAVQIARAAAVLHGRPRPFRFGDLSAAHVMITPRENVKLVNYGLRRVFHAQAGDVLADSAVEVAEDRRGFGRLLCLLLTGREPDSRLLRVPDPLKRLVFHCLEGNDRSGPTFAEIADALDRISAPPPSRKPQRFRVPLLDYRKLREWLLSATLGQPLYRVGLALLAGAVLWHGLAWLGRPGVRPPGEALYVACGQQVWGVSVQRRRIFTRLHLPLAPADLAASSETLYAVAPGMRRLECFSGPEHHRRAGALGRGAESALADQERVFVAHPRLGSLSVVERGRLTAIVPAGLGVRDLALTRGRIVAVSPRVDRLSVFQVDPFQVLPSIPVPGPRSVEAALDGKRLVVASEEGLLVLEEGRIVKRFADLRCASLLARPGGREVWGIGPTGLWGLDVQALRLLGTVALPDSPGDAAFTSGGSELWVSLPDQDRLALVSPVSRQVVMTLRVGRSPRALAVVAGRR